MQRSPKDEFDSWIDLNALPKWSPWPARLLGLEVWGQRNRTTSYVEREYDVEKYGPLLELDKGLNPELVVREQLGPDRLICVGVGDKLALSSLYHAREVGKQFLAQTLAPHIARCRSVVELGCGYGVNLWNLQQQFPDKHYFGGELSPNAVQLAKQACPECHIRVFDLCSEADYELLREIEGPVLVFTVHALEQVASFEPFVTAMRRYNVDSVVNCEPLIDSAYDSLLSQMRRRYIALNGYNANLADYLSKSGIEFEVERDAFGMNPLYPYSVIEWRP